MVYISEKQVKAMAMIGELVDKFGVDRWFTQFELLGITKHTMDALVSKGFLDRMDYNKVVYYQLLKRLGDAS